MCYSLWYNAPTMLPAGNIVGPLFTSCNTQSSAPEDGRDERPKHVELIGIISKPLLLYLVGVYIIYNSRSEDVTVCVAEDSGSLGY